MNSATIETVCAIGAVVLVAVLSSWGLDWIRREGRKHNLTRR
jgi:hypothetical protein